MIEQDFLPPTNIESEQAVLGALIVNSEIVSDVMDTVSFSDFYTEGHRHIFQHIKAMWIENISIDLVSLRERLQSKGIIDDCGGTGYLMTLCNSIPTSANAKYYANIVKKKSTLRKIIQLGQKITALGFKEDNKNVVDTVSRLYNETFQEREIQGAVTSEVLFEQAKAAIPAEKQWLVGLPTGFIDLDLITGGYIEKQLILIAGRPGMGKTAFILNSLIHGARIAKKKQTEGIYIFYSLEQSRIQLALRCASIVFDKEKSVLDFRRGNLTIDERGHLFTVLDNLKALPCLWFEEVDNSIYNFLQRVRRAAREHKILSIIVDHAGQLSYPGMHGEGEAFKIIAQLQSVGKEVNAPVIALHQLNREVEKRADKRPALSDLRQTGNSEQCADLVLGLYRDEYYNSETENPGILEVNILKARDGAIGSVDLVFKKKTLAMFDVNREEGDIFF